MLTKIRESWKAIVAFVALVVATQGPVIVDQLDNAAARWVVAVLGAAAVWVKANLPKAPDA